VSDFGMIPKSNDSKLLAELCDSVWVWRTKVMCQLGLGTKKVSDDSDFTQTRRACDLTNVAQSHY